MTDAPRTTSAAGAANADELLPPALTDDLERRFGGPWVVERLGGLSGAVVARVRLRGGSVVVKGGVGSAEAHFYAHVAPVLRAQGVSIPVCRGAVADGDWRWLVLEDVPEPLPRTRWAADPAVLGVIVRLHGATVAQDDDPPDRFAPGWTDGMTDAALVALLTGARAASGPRLRSLRREAAGLFAPDVPISGDANPANWGVRADGDVVLFDWARYGRGTPALDLAITVPGLGETATYQAVARGYVAAGGRSGAAGDGVLAREIAVAKVWSVVEFLGVSGVEGTAAGRATVAYLREVVPAWLRDVG